MQKSEFLAIVRSYCQPSVSRALFQFFNTFIPFVGILFLMYWLYRYSYWYSLALSVVCAGFLLRLFIIQHDCGHGSFFRSDFWNRWMGRFIGLFTLTPYTFWKSNHSTHHATSGDLDRRNVGDIPTMTVREYLAATPAQKFIYRFYRNPLTLLLVGAPGLFIIAHRLPWYLPLKETRLWRSVISYNILLTGILGTLVYFLGVSVLLVYLPVIVIAAMAGTYMFYVQHQFEGTYWKRHHNWNFVDAAMLGCSYYKLPKVLNWFTGNIAYHHIHHLCSKIPNYELRNCFNENLEFQAVHTLKLLDGIRCFQLALWDEESEKLISFRQLGKLKTTQKSA